MRELLIATTNPAKLAEYQLLLRDFELRPIGLRDAGITQTAPEDGANFAENARLKALFYFGLARIATLADDGGLEVDALEGAPGVHSHRWLGVADPDDWMLAEEVIRRMVGVPPAWRTARMRAAVDLVWDEAGVPREAIAEAALEGVIAEYCYHEIRPGFPYRSVLWLPQRNCFVAELSDLEAAQLSQRRAALAQLSAPLKQLSSAQP
jgi:XTP/dITP diphosphohydrolase